MADDALDRALAYAGTPAEAAWRKFSDRVLQARGDATYTQPLVPGFDEFKADDVLMLPTEDQYREQVARGETPRYVEDNDIMARRGQLVRAKRLATELAKLSYEISWEGSREPYVSDTNPEGRNYSEDAEDHVDTGVDIAWEGNANQAPGSDTEEPSGKNPILSGGTRG